MPDPYSRASEIARRLDYALALIDQDLRTGAGDVQTAHLAALALHAICDTLTALDENDPLLGRIWRASGFPHAPAAAQGHLAELLRLEGERTA
ncbi:hypothetical protein [Acidisoma sp. 7E03]